MLQYHINNRGIFTEPLPSNDRGEIHTHTHTDSNVISQAYFIFKNKESRLKKGPF
jgi:hypothetical protein